MTRGVLKRSSLSINKTRQSPDHACRAAGDGEAKTAGSASLPEELEPPFTPRAGRVPTVPDQNLVKKFGPHRPSDGDSPQQKGGSDEVSLSFKGEQFQGFSVFASPAPPVRRKSSKDLK